MPAGIKTSYDQDIDLVGRPGAALSYGLLGLLLLAAPLLLTTFYVDEMSFVFIYAIAGLGLMILTGYTGQVSVGHSAFLGVGAYCHAYLLTCHVPFLVSFLAAACLSGLVGLIIGLPALRMSGIYLAIATLAIAAVMQQVFISWESVTGGFNGLAVPPPDLLGLPTDQPAGFYYLCGAILVLTLLACANLLRSPTGRAWIAIRESEIAAQGMGINLAKYKSIAFAISAFITGMAGALMAHKIGFLAPDVFTITLSVQLLLLVVVGGLGSLHGAVYGAIFVGILPVLIAILRDYLPADVARQPGLEPGIFGAILVLFILFEPAGIYGRWMKIKRYFALFPFVRSVERRQRKVFARAEHV